MYKPKIFSTYLMFTKEQRIAILLLVFLIVLLQLMFCFVDFSESKKITQTERNWLALQKEIDSLKVHSQLKTNELRPFNPNFITDFKGYKLGMTLDQIDRLLAFRKQNKFVNSAAEFQKVTGVSDSLLGKIAPFFKFPDWVINRQKTEKSSFAIASYFSKKEEKKEVILDINLATKEQLMEVYGVGEALSDRILKQKEVFGDFVSMEQVNDVWGLQPEVVEKIEKKFMIIQKPNPKKININSATIKELGQFPYFRYPISKNIVTYRSMNGDIKIEDLVKIKAFPIDKIKIIALYLDF